MLEVKLPFLGRIAFKRDTVEWGYVEEHRVYSYYFMVSRTTQEQVLAYAKTGSVSWGLHRLWHDGPHAALVLPLVTFSWSTRYTRPPEEFK